MVIGSDVVHLNLCACTGTADHYELVRSWAKAVASQLTAPAT
jgi:hypothetical protein